MVDLDLRRFEIAVPAVLTIIAMPLTFSISTGIGLGLIALVAICLGLGRGRDLSAVTYALAAVFLLHFFEPLLLRLLSSG